MESNFTLKKLVNKRSAMLDKIYAFPTKMKFSKLGTDLEGDRI